MTHRQAVNAGLHVERLTAYVDQGEIHMAQLTVKETLEFESRSQYM
jgi:ABC-type multidrug transport system ATPase subunit